MPFIREGAVVDRQPLAVCDATGAFEGDAPDGIVPLEFPSADLVRAWYACPQYQAALPDRHRGAPYRAIPLEGLPVRETTA